MNDDRLLLMTHGKKKTCRAALDHDTILLLVGYLVLLAVHWLTVTSVISDDHWV